MRRSIFIIFLFFEIITAVKSQDVKVISSFDSIRIYIGDQIKFSIIVEQPSGLNLTLPIYKDTICKNIDIISGPVIDSSKSDDGRLKIIEKYLITSFDSGLYQIPPVYAEMKNDAGLKRFYSDYSKLQVLRVNVAPADTSLKIFDIIKPYRAPVSLGEIIPWVLIIALLGVLIWAAIKFVRKLRKNKTVVEEVINPDPAHIIGGNKSLLYKAYRDNTSISGKQVQRLFTRTYYSRDT
jgi:hypothetical protein